MTKWDNKVILKGKLSCENKIIKKTLLGTTAALGLHWQTLLGAHTFSGQKVYWCSSWRFTFENIFTHEKDAACCVPLTTCCPAGCALRVWPDLYSSGVFSMTLAGSQHWQGESCPLPSSQTTGVNRQSPKELFVLTAEIFFHSAELSVSPHLPLPCAVPACTLACSHYLSISHSLCSTHTHTHTPASPKAMVFGCVWNYMVV